MSNLEIHKFNRKFKQAGAKNCSHIELILCLNFKFNGQLDEIDICSQTISWSTDRQAAFSEVDLELTSHFKAHQTSLSSWPTQLTFDMLSYLSI